MHVGQSRGRPRDVRHTLSALLAGTLTVAVAACNGSSGDSPSAAASSPDSGSAGMPSASGSVTPDDGGTRGNDPIGKIPDGASSTGGEASDGGMGPDASVGTTGSSDRADASSTTGTSTSDASSSNEEQSYDDVVAGIDPTLPIEMTRDLATARVGGDSEDPAIWIHPTRPERSLVITTNKTAAPEGSLVVYNLDGQIVQRIEGLDRPNNVDVQDGFELEGRPVSLVVATERLASVLRAYRIEEESGELIEVNIPGGIPVFEGESQDSGAPMGIGLYQRSRDGELFAIVSRKTGPTTGYLWQYRLREQGDSGHVFGTKVREFGNFSGQGEIEAVVVDDTLGYVYYSDEGAGIRKWHADPEHAEADTELALFGTKGFEADREGLAIYEVGATRGYIIATDQLEGHSRFHMFRREGTLDDPHDHTLTVKVLESDADKTDGIEATSHSLGSQFPDGLLVVMNENGDDRNYLYYDWHTVADAGVIKLNRAAPSSR